MSISFKDYIVIAEALKDEQLLDEGAVWDAIKKKLGAKASPEETEAELARLKKIAPAEFEKIKAAEKAKLATANSKDDKKAALASAQFAARRALKQKQQDDLEKAAKARSSLSGASKKLDQTDPKDYSGAQLRAAERRFALGDSKEVNSFDDAIFEDASNDEKLFVVRVPANTYGNNSYSFKAAPIHVLAKSEDEASSLINKHKDDIVRHLASKKVSGKSFVRAVDGHDKNIFFKKSYYVEPSPHTSWNDVLTRHGGFKKVTLK